MIKCQGLITRGRHIPHLVFTHAGRCYRRGEEQLITAPVEMKRSISPLSHRAVCRLSSSLRTPPFKKLMLEMFFSLQLSSEESPTVEVTDKRETKSSLGGLSGGALTSRLQEVVLTED